MLTPGCPARRALATPWPGRCFPARVEAATGMGEMRTLSPYRCLCSRPYLIISASVRARCPYHGRAAHHVSPALSGAATRPLIIARCVPSASAHTNGAAEGVTRTPARIFKAVVPYI